MPLFRSKAEDKVRDAGYDPARLPPGQYLTEKWPVLHAGEIPDVDLATWPLRVFGEVEEEVTLELRGAPAAAGDRVTTDIHCVTRWSRFDARFSGVHWRELAKLCRPEAARALRDRARRARLHRERPARGTRGRERARRLRGRRRAARRPSTAGPCGSSSRRKYFWKSAKWLSGIELSRGRQAGLLGALRLPQRRRFLERGALRLLVPERGISAGVSAPIEELPTSPSQVKSGASRAASLC